MNSTISETPPKFSTTISDGDKCRTEHASNLEIRSDITHRSVHEPYANTTNAHALQNIETIAKDSVVNATTKYNGCDTTPLASNVSGNIHIYKENHNPPVVSTILNYIKHIFKNEKTYDLDAKKDWWDFIRCSESDAYPLAKYKF